MIKILNIIHSKTLILVYYTDCKIKEDKYIHNIAIIKSEAIK